MGELTTHVLDTSVGRPGRGMRVELFRLDGGRRDKLSELVTNDDGRGDGPVLAGERFVVGVYELVFHAAEYFAREGREPESPPFLDEVVLRFRVSAPREHYHVPLLLSPYGYTTYRGS